MSQLARSLTLLFVCISLCADTIEARDGCAGDCRRGKDVGDSSHAEEPNGSEWENLPAPDVVVNKSDNTFVARSGDQHPAMRPVDLGDFQFLMNVNDEIARGIETVQWRIDGVVYEKTNPLTFAATIMPSLGENIHFDTKYLWNRATPGRHTIEGRYLWDEGERRVWSPWSATVHLEVRLPEPPVPIAIGNEGKVPTSIRDGRLAVRITSHFASVTLKGVIGADPIVECLDERIPGEVAFKLHGPNLDEQHVLDFTGLLPGTYDLVFRNSDAQKRWTSHPSKSIRIEYEPRDRCTTFQVINKNATKKQATRSKSPADAPSFCVDLPEIWPEILRRLLNCILLTHYVAYDDAEPLPTPPASSPVPRSPSPPATVNPPKVDLVNKSDTSTADCTAKSLPSGRSVCATDDTNGGFARLINPQALDSQACCDKPAVGCEAEGLKHSIWFEQPAHFARNEFGLKGAPLAREGALIYEGMRFNWQDDGKYEVAFLTEIPAIRTELRLQLVIRVKGSGWQTITLPPFLLDPNRSSSEYRSGVYKVVHRGFSPAIAHYAIEGQTNTLEIRRVGTARFGFGIAE